MPRQNKNSQKRLLIFGASGLLGRELINYFTAKKWKIYSPKKDRADITDLKKITGLLKKIRPKIIINCAAQINVDYCEANPLDAWMANAIGPGNIALAMRSAGLSGSTLIQISSSDIFGPVSARLRRGKQSGKFFGEDDRPVPVNMYGWSKLAGEEFVRGETKQGKIRFFIIRAGWLYGQGRSTFVDMAYDALKHARKSGIIADQYNIPVWTRDLAEFCGKLIVNKKYKSGVYHATSRVSKPVSKYDIALAIAKFYGKKAGNFKKSSFKKVFLSPRPQFATLKTKYFYLPDWKTSLKKYLFLKYGRK